MHAKYLKAIVLTPILAVVLLISGCSNSTNNNITPYYTISEEFTDYCWFEAGSYWVFQDDSTLLTDTIKVNNVTETKRFHNEHGTFNYQAVEMYTSSVIFDFTKYELTAGNSEPKLTGMNSLLRLYKNDGSYHLVFLPQYPVGEEIDMGNETGYYTNIEILNTFFLNGTTYQDVYHTRVKIPAKNSEYNYWIAKYHSIIYATIKIDGQTSSISLKSDHLIVK